MVSFVELKEIVMPPFDPDMRVVSDEICHKGVVYQLDGTREVGNYFFRREKYEYLVINKDLNFIFEM